MSLGAVWNTYMISTSLYGAVRKVAVLNNAKLDYLNTDTRKFERKPMLLGTKCAIVTIAGAMGPYLFPWNAYTDINKLGLAIKGESPSAYGYEYKTVFDYIYG